MAGNTSAIGIYTDRTTVSDAINVLHKAGFRATDISVLASDNQGSKDFAHEKQTKAAKGAASGAAVCAAVGAALACLVSVQAVSITGLAPLKNSTCVPTRSKKMRSWATKMSVPLKFRR